MTYFGFTMLVNGIPAEYKDIQIIEHRMLFPVDPNLLYNNLRYELITTCFRDKHFTKSFSLINVLDKCKQYNIIPIINICATEWYGKDILNKLTPQGYAKIGGIIRDYLIERGFKKAYISAFNEPGKVLDTKKTCEYTNALHDEVGKDYDVVYGNDEFNMLDWNYLGKNCRAKVMGIHHLSSVGFWDDPYKYFSNIRDCKTIANLYGKDVIGTECGSWFKDYCKEGHKVNLDILAECKKYDYTGCLIVLPDINEYSKTVWKLLGYRVWDIGFNKIKSGCNDKFTELLKYIKENGKKYEEEKVDRLIKLTTPVMEGADVRQIENKLRELGFDIKVNSRYENDDYHSVRIFQQESKIVVDGIVGPVTKEKLKATNVNNFYPEVFKKIYEKKDYSIEAIDYFLSEYGHPNLAGHGKYFKQAENETEIPVEWQLANGMQESGTADSTGRVRLGNSYYGREWKNLYGWAITDSGPLPEGRFETYKDCILAVAHKIKDLFLDPNNWRYGGDNIFGIEKYYSTAPYNAILKAKWYKFICSFIDKGVRHKVPEYIEDLVPLLSEYFIRRG
ncbi:MAG: peptidoglycan-binding protein [Methanofastidiosum sp.]